MKRLLLGLTLLASMSSFASETCDHLQRKVTLAKLEARYSKDNVEMYKELYSDAKTTSRISKGLAAISAGLLVGTPYASGVSIVGSTSYIDGVLGYALGKALLQPVGAVIAAYTGGLSIDSSVQKEKFNDEVSNFVYANDAILAFDRVVQTLDKKRSEVDLNWSRLGNALTFGHIAQKQTMKLFEIALAKDAVLENKVNFIEKVIDFENCQ